MSSDSRALSRMAAGFLLLLAILTIAGITLTPVQFAPSGRLSLRFLLCLVCGEQGLVDSLLNIALFVPYGLALRVLGLSTRRVVWVAVLTSVGIEVLQWGVVAGRHPQVRDVLMNGAGGALGVLLAVHWRSLVKPSPLVARRLAAVSVIVWVLQLLLTSWALAPSPPETTPRYWVQWAHVFPDSWPFRGSIVDADLNGIPIPDGPFPDVQSVENELRSGSIAVNVDALGALPTQGRSQIVALANNAYRVALRLQQVGCDFELKVRLRSADVGLNYPAVRLNAPCRSDSKGDVFLSARVDDAGLSLLARDGDELVERRLPFSPNLGWSFFHPFDVAFSDPWLASTLWVASLLFVVAYWAGQSTCPRCTTAALAAAIAAGFIGIPLWFGFHPVPWTEWVAAAMGVLAGLVAGRVATGLLMRSTGGGSQ